MSTIREIRVEDAEKVSDLLSQLDYPNTEDFIEEKIISLINHPDEECFVYEVDNQVVGFMSMHFIPQIALEGCFARISYFIVDIYLRSGGIGEKMEEHCVQLAEERNCDRIELHSHSRREGAHKFYYRQGYEEIPKYLVKKLSKK